MEKRSDHRRKLIRRLYFERHASCAALSKALGLSLPSTAKLLNQCIAKGVLIEEGLAPSTGGRRAMMYALKGNALFTVAVAMDQLVTRISIMDMEHRPVCAVRSVELPLKNNPDALSELTRVIEETISGCGISKDQIVGIGIGMPGFIDVNKGINHSFMPCGDRSITQYIREATGLPVYIDNDSSLIALAESRFSKAKGRGTVMVINIGWGIGLGMLLNGQLFRGNNGLAGEFSHIPMFDNNILCSCGKTGCLETESSLVRLAEKARAGLQNGTQSKISEFPQSHITDTVEAIIQSAAMGDRFAVQLISEAGYHIGRGAAILIHLFNPSLIVLSGRGSLAGKLWLAPVQQAINEHSIPKLAEHTRVELSELGHTAELIGAAGLVMEHFGSDVSHIKLKQTDQ